MIKRKNLLISGLIALGTSIVIYLSRDSLLQNSNQISSILAHPLVLLLVGTTISSILIPRFTQKAQDNKRKREIQIELGREISKASTQAIAISIAMTAKKDTMKDQAECVIALKKIETDLWAYFPQTNLANDWLEYADVLQSLWPLTKNLWEGPLDLDQNKNYLDMMKKYHNKINSHRQIDWDKLYSKDFSQAETEYYNLRTFIFEEFKKFVVLVHWSHITIF